jgi:hypothetical protein
MAGERERVLEEQLQALLEGKVRPPNEMVAHAVRRANEAAKEGNRIAQQLQALRKQAEELRDRGVRLNGARDSYHDDIREILLKLEGADDGTAEK